MLRYKSQYCPNNYLDLMMQSVEQLYVHHPICSSAACSHFSTEIEFKPWRKVELFCSAKNV